MVKNILWHTWEPGLCGDFLSSGGGAAWTRYLWSQIEREGHQVVLNTVDPECDGARRIELTHLQQVDIGIFCWRWLLGGKYTQRDNYYFHQWDLIDRLLELGIPVLIHDQDHRVASADAARLAEASRTHSGVYLSAPELHPRARYIELHYPSPYTTGITQTLPQKDTDFVYIGNNYDRYEQFKHFFNSQSDCKIDVYGNWLEPSALRESPEQVQSDFPYIDFKGRLPQDKVVETLSHARATVHLAKPSYCETGFLTIRWAEAVAAGCPAFIPKEFKIPEHLIPRWRRMNGLLMSVMKKFNAFSLLDELLEAERQLVVTKMRVEPWLDFIQENAR